MTAEEQPTPTAQASTDGVTAAVLSWIDKPRHEPARHCPGCGVDLVSTALVNLAYTFETCSCAHATYVHLIEQLWHRACLIFSGGRR